MAATSSSISLKEYLKRYSDEPNDAKKKKKKKKEKPNPSSAGGGVIVVDEDPVWQKPVKEDAEEDEASAVDETPQVEEDIEVKRMKRLEALRSLKPYHSINEDGSGWVSIPKATGPSRESAPRQIRPVSGDEDISPPPHQRRQRFDSPSTDNDPADLDTDLSPPRARRRRVDTPSPEHQLNGPGGKEGDLSPPRRRRNENLSPVRRAQTCIQEVEYGRGTLDNDISPPRKPGRGLSEDLSPPLKAQSLPAADLSPPRRTRKSPLDDLSLPRRASKPSESTGSSIPHSSHSQKDKFASSENLSVSRRAPHGSSESTRNTDLSSSSLLHPKFKEPLSTKEAKRGGILTGKEMRAETEKKRMEEKSRFASMDPLLTGRGAEAVYRDKEGKRVSKEELMKSKEEKKEEKPLEWGRGLAQKREAEERLKELKLEKERPFARSRDDPELDMMLKERMRWGDPMAHLVKRKSSELVLEDLGESEKMKESGFVVPQAIPSHSWLKRGLDFPPNRYSIKPGRHWDGVDRSNGYEKELFKRQNEKRATETEAYLWSVSEM